MQWSKRGRADQASFSNAGCAGLDRQEEMELSVAHTHILLCLILSDVYIRLIRLWNAGEKIQMRALIGCWHLLVEYWLVELWTNA